MKLTTFATLAAAFWIGGASSIWVGGDIAVNVNIGIYLVLALGFLSGKL